jgi:hypothetical protein
MASTKMHTSQYVNGTQYQIKTFIDGVSNLYATTIDVTGL